MFKIINKIKKLLIFKKYLLEKKFFVIFLNFLFKKNNKIKKKNVFKKFILCYFYFDNIQY